MLQISCHTSASLTALDICGIAGTVPVKEFEDARMYADWSVDPLLVAAHSAKFAGCQMAATLLSTDQVGAGHHQREVK